MVHVSIKDPLWEVKTFTYEFWSSVIKKFITKPSKLNNIETLNEKLAKLSATGCLHVSWLIKFFLSTIYTLFSIQYKQYNYVLGFICCIKRRT